MRRKGGKGGKRGGKGGKERGKRRRDGRSFESLLVVSMYTIRGRRWEAVGERQHKGKMACGQRLTTLLPTIDRGDNHVFMPLFTLKEAAQAQEQKRNSKIIQYISSSWQDDRNRNISFAYMYFL